MRILVAEDERDLNRLICRTLERAGYSVDACFDGEAALDYLLGAEYDCLLLDIMMPKKDGREVLREVRAQGSAVPVIFLTARDSVQDRIEGLDLGADDYLVKPFDFDELLARIRAATRKYGTQKTSVLTLADLTVDTGSHTVTRGGQGIRHPAIYDAAQGYGHFPCPAGGSHLELRLYGRLECGRCVYHLSAQKDRQRL